MATTLPKLKTLRATEITRPANTTAYTAGDAVGATAGTVMEFENAFRYNSGGVKVKGAKVSKSAASTTNATFDLYLYTEAPAAIADNAAWTTLYADADKFAGKISLTMISGGGAAVAVATADIPVQAQGDASLYGVLVATGAYTPGSAETFRVEIQVEQY